MQHPAVGSRDLTLDLARVACVVLVMVVHLLFAGVTTVDGAIVLERTAELQPWFIPASWVGEIMPLFFLIGGYAAYGSWRRASQRGATSADFARGRIARIARPVLPLFAFFAIGLAAAAALGLPAELVDGIAVGVGSPLWFLGAYLLVQAAVPVMVRLHERRPVATLTALIAAAVLVDVVRLSVREPLLGLPNVLFVWLAVQQLGFWLHDGWFDRRRPIVLVALIAACFALLLPIVPAAGYSPNMLANQYPPTVPLIVLGVAQASALRLLQRPLAALMRTRAARAVVFVFGSRLMTIYLWHLPVIMALIGVQLVLPFALSVPGTPAWWWERIPVFAAVVAVTLALSLVLRGFEGAPPLHARPTPWRVWVATAMCAAPPLAVMVWGLDLALAIFGVAATAIGLWLAGIPARAAAKETEPASARPSAARMS